MNKELQHLESRGWQAEFPVLLSLSHTPTSAIFQLQSYVTVKRSACIKFKLVNGQVALKMRCGSYLYLERLGPFFTELCLDRKFGLTYHVSDFAE